MSRGTLLRRARSVFLSTFRLRVDAQITYRLLLVVLPVAAAVMGIKAYKLMFALWPVTQNTFNWHRPGLFETLKIIFSSPLSVCMVGALIGILLPSSKTLRRRLLFAFLVALGLFVLLCGLKFAVAIVRETPLVYALPLHQSSRLWREFLFIFSVYRGSVLFVLVYTCFALLLLNRFRANARMYWLLQGLNILLVGVGALELAHYLKTGVNGSGPLMLYALKNSADLAAIVNSEMDRHALAALALPFLLWGFGCLMVWASVRLLAMPRRSGTVAAGYVIWPAYLCAFAFPMSLEQGYVRLASDPFSTITYDLAVRPVVRWVRGNWADPVQVSPVPELRFTASSAVPASQPKNVVLVMLESVRASSTSVYEPSLATTPFLADLARRSLVVDQMYAVVPRTSASWMAILHGIYPSTNSAMAVWGRQVPTGTSLPRLLAAQGYETAFFVPTHLEYENEGQLIRNMGFHHIVTVNELPPAPRVNYFGVEDRLLLQPMIEWVDEQTTHQRPFFLTVMTNIGHHKYELPPSWEEKQLSAGNDADYNRYLNCIAYIDDVLRQFVDDLGSRGLLESTVLIVVGDHGDAFGEHGARQHVMALYEEILHVPMLIHAPALFTEGGRITGPRQQVDILPTVADALGFDITGGVPTGSSLLSSSDKQKLFFTSTLEEVALAMRDGDEKFVYSFGRQPMEIYNLALDPGERHNLAASYPRDRRDRAAEEMLGWYRRSMMTLLLKPAPVGQ